MILYLPSPENQSETYAVVIEQIQYQIFFTYNPSFDFWVFKMTLGDETFIDTVTLTQGVDVAYNTILPPTFGRLFVTSLTGDDSDPNLENFGNSVFLAYETTI